MRRHEARKIWFNVSLERRFFLNLIQNTRLTAKKKKWFFLEEEKEEIIFARNCVECRVVNYLPSFQFLRLVV